MDLQPRTDGPAETRPIMLGTRAQQVAERLQSEIVSGGFPPGTRLRQGDIATRYGVSTTPVREAFALLQSLGLVRIDAHRGAIVFLPSVRELEELYEIREALETLATRRSIENLDEEGVKRLKAQYHKMETSSGDEWVHEHREFHRSLYEMADRPHLLSMIVGLRDSSGAFVPAFQPGNRPIKQEHKNILTACIKRDVDGAVEAIQHHLRVTLEGARAHLSAVIQSGATS
jgi:DNA-binding GntR family transcriptional regulator